MRICLLSYQVNHRKTFDVLFGLKSLGYENVCVYAKPFHYAKRFKPLYEHRPSCEFTIYQHLDYENVISNFGYELYKVYNYEDIHESGDCLFLICGAGILPNEFVDAHMVINSHPGYIPNERGLDSYKWAIVENQPIGVTTHFVGDYVDGGNIIKRERVPVYKNDTFHSVAERVYETEVRLLLDAITDHKISFHTDGDKFCVHKRMQEDVEKNLLAAFDDWKNNNLDNSSKT